MKKVWMVGVVVYALGFLAGCECDPESDAELCGDEHCGLTTLIDNCDDERDVDCGECGAFADCEDNICICQPESDAELCAQEQANCGTVDTVDRCDDERTVACGSCEPTHECMDNQCHCVGESEEKLCDDAGFQCGSATVTDACGDERDIQCTSCSSPDECIDHQCQCIGESDDELCAAQNMECGPATVTDQCGDDRQIDCGGCDDPDACVDNLCECQPESESELCADGGYDCGSTTVTDQCGDSRDISCGECTAPFACEDNQCHCDAESESQLCAAAEADGQCGSLEVTDRCDETRQISCDPCPEGRTTFGAVRNADTGTLIDGAHMRVYTWPPPEGSAFDWAWPAGHRENNPDFETTTSTTAPGDFNYEFATEEPICMDDRVATLEPHQWYRIVIDHPDYNPGIFYRLHQGYDAAECPAICPTDAAGGCHRQDFEIWPAGASYPQYPNLLADERELGQNEWQCALMPDEAPHDRLIGLRVRIGAANVGQGDFHLEATDTGGGEVVQHIYWSDGSTDTTTINSEFEFHEGHQHTHFMDWFAVRLIEPTDACRDVDERSGNCIVDEGLKISFCLHDLDPFDGDIADHYDGFSSRFPDPPTCDTTEQGVTVSWKDTYRRALPGQVVIVGPPSQAANLGTTWIEAEVDPDQVLEEADRHGNIARLPVDGPSPDTLCTNPNTTLDCSMPPEDYTTTQQQRQCRDYIEY